jgi:beta-lactamase superfamily II metal-dependent hydrolase
VLETEPLLFEILKLPHHGSVRDYGPDFFQGVRARHYVISANGRYGNPEDQTLRWLIDSRSDDDFTIWLTNRHNAQHPDYEHG